MKIIDLTSPNEVLPPHEPIADAEVGDTQYEIAVTVDDRMPMVINWRDQVAWVGDWGVLIERAATQVRKRESS